jgi:deoxyxylulose-5-phosphate synthase
VPRGFLNICIPDAYVEHGNPHLLKEFLKLDVISITNQIMELAEKFDILPDFKF